MLIKDFADEKKVLLYLSNQEYVYNDIILCEHNGKKYGILINSGKTNKIVESAKELAEQGYGDCEVVDRIEEKIKNIFN